MNNNRRQRLQSCRNSLGYIKISLEAAVDKLNYLLNFKQEINDLSKDVISISERLKRIYDEEENAYNSLPENLQFSDMADKIGFAMGDIEDAINNTDKLLDNFDALEEVYFQFLGSYNPQQLICKIESVMNGIALAQQDIDIAQDN